MNCITIASSREYFQTFRFFKKDAWVVTRVFIKSTKQGVLVRACWEQDGF
jgi:hypothetical protein